MPGSLVYLQKFLQVCLTGGSGFCYCCIIWVNRGVVSSFVDWWLSFVEILGCFLTKQFFFWVLYWCISTSKLFGYHRCPFLEIKRFQIMEINLWNVISGPNLLLRSLALQVIWPSSIKERLIVFWHNCLILWFLYLFVWNSDLRNKNFLGSFNVNTLLLLIVLCCVRFFENVINSSVLPFCLALRLLLLTLKNLNVVQFRNVSRKRHFLLQL